MNNNFENSFNQDQESFDIKREFSYYLFFWPWFLLSIFFCLIGSFTYLRYTPNVYSSSAQVQITKSDASSSFLTTEVTSLFGTRINVENDIGVITSNHILSKVAKQLDFQTTITSVGRVKSSLNFTKDLPFEIYFKDSIKTQKWRLLFSLDLATISNSSSSFIFDKKKSLETDDFILIMKDSLYESQEEFIINRTSLQFATAILKKRIKADPVSKNGEIINLSI